MAEIDTILKHAHSQYGADVGGKGVTVHAVERIPTGMFPLDLATGGGFPRGKISEVYGPESSGKSTVCYKAIAYVQHVLKQDAVLVDVEHSFDPIWASYCGVDTETLILLHPETAEVAVDLIDATIRADTVGIVVLDSVGSMITYNEADSEAGKQAVGGSAQICSKMARKVGQALLIEGKRGHRPALICINQIRFKIGVTHGNPETTPGGMLLRFAYALRLRLYGKEKMVKEVSANHPAFKEISGIVKKWKVPIVSRNFVLDMCLIPHANLSITETLSWNTVAGYLKSHGVIVKAGTKFLCFGEEFKTLTAIRKRYDEDEAYRQQLQDAVVELEMVHGQPLSPQD